MQWSDAPNAGFSEADPEDVYNGVIDEGPFGYHEVNVADQLERDDSLLSRIERIVDARHRCSEIGSGEFSIVDADPKEVWAHRFDDDGTVLLAVHSTADEPREVTVPFEPPAEATVRVLGPADYDVHADSVTIRADDCGFAWLRGDRHGRRVPV
jgi:maltose alpha-D-glucosyltransferase/alpha-amylase